MTKSDVELALSNIRDIGGVRRAATILYAGTPRFGSATLSSGSVTVTAPWVLSGSLFNATPQTSGTGIIYVNPADIVAGTSFKIKSTDAADGRHVFWTAMINKPGTSGPGA